MDEESEALDAYSRVVIGVAEMVLPSVASLLVSTGRGEGAGSASVLTEDGYLLTSAHVVDGAAYVKAAFVDGTEQDVSVVGRDPLSDLAVLRAHQSVPPPYGWATQDGFGSVSSLLRSATRSGLPVV